MKVTPRGLLVAAALLCASSLLVACGSGDDGTAPRTTTSAEPDGNDLPEDACRLLDTAALSTALGATVTTSQAPVRSCDFSQEDPRALRGSFGVVADAATNGGLRGYLSGLEASLTDATTHDVTGLGGDASVTVGLPAMGSGENLMAAGAVDHGDVLLQVTLVQARGMSEADLTAAAERVLRLLDEAA